MKMLTKFVAALALAGMMGTASADVQDTATYVFKTESGTSFADLTVSVLDPGKLTFTLALSDFSSIFDNNQNRYVSLLDFGAVPGGLHKPKIDVFPSLNSVNGISVKNLEHSPYDFQFVFGSGKDRLTSGETVTWTASFQNSEHSKDGKNRSPYDGFGLDGSAFGLQLSSLGGGDSRKSQFVTGSLVPAVPEPAEWAMMVAGLGMMGFMVRRRTARAS